MIEQTALDCADRCIEVILTADRLPVARCTTPDTRNAVACIISQCWNTTGMERERTQDCMAHVGMFGVPVVRIVRVNAHGNDTCPAHVLVAVCDLIHDCFVANSDERRRKMQDRITELRKKSANAS